MTTIDDSNYEQWLLLYAERELTAEQRGAVERWLALHPETAEELALYNEAPRLEKDETIRYAATPSQTTLPLWPAVLRWSAAAVVVVALMVPVARLSVEKIPTVAPVQVAVVQEKPISVTEEVLPVQPRPVVRKVSVVVTEAEEPMPVIVEETVPESLTVEDTLPVETTIPESAPTYCDHLIDYAPAPDTLYSNALIAYDHVRPSWRDVVREWWTESRVHRNLQRHAAEFYALGESTVNFSN